MNKTFLRRSLLIGSVVITAGLAACGGGGGGNSVFNDTSGSSAITTLQSTDTVVGTGLVATTGKKVTVHYTGWLYDVKAAGTKGSKIDSSLDRGQPFTFPLGAGEVIAGWDQGVPGMKMGGKRTLVIPASLAYGSAGSRNGVVPPNAALVFEVEMLGVQ